MFLWVDPCSYSSKARLDREKNMAARMRLVHVVSLCIVYINRIAHLTQFTIIHHHGRLVLFFCDRILSLLNQPLFQVYENILIQWPNRPLFQACKEFSPNDQIGSLSRLVKNSHPMTKSLPFPGWLKNSHPMTCIMYHTYNDNSFPSVLPGNKISYNCIHIVHLRCL